MKARAEAQYCLLLASCLLLFLDLILVTLMISSLKSSRLFVLCIAVLYWPALQTHLLLGLIGGNGTVNSLDHYTGDLVWVGVGGGSTILEIALAFTTTLPGDADG